MSGWRQVWAIARKDVQLELRSRGMLSALGVFALGTLVIFAFAFELEKIPTARLVPGVLWVTVLFSSLLALNRMFTLEERQDAFYGLLLSPVDRAVIFAGKVLGGLFFVVIVQAMTLLLMLLWFGLPVAMLPPVAALALLGDVGLVSAGTLLASMAFRTRAREAVLPALLLPVAFPWLLCGVKATTAVLLEAPWSDYQMWVAVMGVFDIIFLTTGWLAFEAAIED